MSTMKVDVSARLQPDEAERAATIRATLPGQQQHDRLARAEAQFGLSHDWVTLADRVSKSLPRSFRFLNERRVRYFDVETYPRRIPDKALLRYDDAKRSGLFERFLIVEPFYLQDASAQDDPWLVGRVGDNRWIILAYWV